MTLPGSVAIFRQMGEKLSKAAKDAGRLIGCWVSPGWSDGLSVPERADWPRTERPEEGMSGLVTVLVARRAGEGQAAVCGYLVDVYCLGVKNAWGPRLVYRRDLAACVEECFAAYPADPLPAPLELARQIVYGAVDYAVGLGFAPHPDFALAAGHLGPWAGPSLIGFGRAGRPLFVQGSQDDAEEVLRVLDRTVGRGQYDALVFA